MACAEPDLRSLLSASEARDATLVLQAAAEAAALMGGVGCAAMDWAALCGASPSSSLLPAVTTWLRGGGDVAAGAWEAPLALQKLAAAHAAHRVLPVRVAALMSRLERPADTFTTLLEVLQCPPPAPLHQIALTMRHGGSGVGDSGGGLGGLLSEAVAVAAAQVNTPVASISLLCRTHSVPRQQTLPLARLLQGSTGLTLPSGQPYPADQTKPLMRRSLSVRYVDNNHLPKTKTAAQPACNISPFRF